MRSDASHPHDAAPAALEPGDASDLWSGLAGFLPRARVRTLDWAVRNVVNEAGRPYDHAAFPHLGAPGGPLDAFDAPGVREISMQFATRLGKTFAGHVCLMKSAEIDPGPAMVASSVESTAMACSERLYAMLRARPRLAAMLVKSEAKAKQDLIELRESRVFFAWSRSVSTLADKNCRVGHANEYDKWEHSKTSREAHPHKLFTDRFKDFWGSRKIISEGTPTLKGKSPIEHARLAGTNCRFHVPCPHCGRYQPIEFSRLKWERDDDGKTDRATANRTARYECAAAAGGGRTTTGRV